ncbi:hypothetical protein D9M68_716080 [compost metagenome]
MVTAVMNRVPRALISGLRPSRTRDSTTSGSGLEPGPERKADMITSSREMVNASSQLAISAWEICGRVMSKNTRSGVAPRFCAASARDWSMLTRRDWMVMAT